MLSTISEISSVVIGPNISLSISDYLTREFILLGLEILSSLSFSQYVAAVLPFKVFHGNTLAFKSGEKAVRDM